MVYIPRKIESLCKKAVKAFPILTLTGPRQSGKSTMLKQVFPDWTYINLEDSSHQDFAVSDPKGFLSKYRNKIILDEIQRTPQLLSQLQVTVDEDRSNGRFILSGSHNLLLLEQVSQSLAGRTVIHNLLPFAYGELHQQKIAPPRLEDALYFGGYPLAQLDRANAHQWLDSYIQTYLERDVRLIRNVTDLSTFRRFIRMCAGRAAQLLDLSGLGGDVGISHNTARDWFGVLEAGFIAFRLEPYFRNFSKRLIKSPKLYFYDTGLLCRLLEIRSSDDLVIHPMRGAIFENWCVVEALKAFLNAGKRPALAFWRDQNIEVDLLIEQASTKLHALECKSGLTVVNEFLDIPIKFANFAKGIQVDSGVVYGGKDSQIRSTGKFWGWQDYATQLDGFIG